MLQGTHDTNISFLQCTYSGTTLATFKHHTGPITSVEWHPIDSTVFASSGEDDQVAWCVGAWQYTVTSLNVVVKLTYMTHSKS